VERQSIFFSAPAAAELRTEALPPPGPGEALVETLLSAISPGSELLVYRGQAPGDMAVDETIAALAGSFRFPIKFGYAAVGRVIGLGEGAPAGWLGRTVFAFNPHETHFVAPVAALHPLPDDIAPEAAVFLPNMETAVSFVMDGRPIIGERVAVVGQGVVGLLTTALLSDFPLAGLLTLDGYPLRREWSARLGATDVFDPTALDLRGLRRPLRSDLTYELSGNPRALDTAIALTGDYGRVVIGSWYGNKRAELDLGGRFHRAHMQLIGSQVSALAPRWLGRWTKGRRLDVAWEMLRRHRPERLITHRLPLDRAAEAYQLLDRRPEETVQIVFTYQQGEEGPDSRGI
jgi:2-desacetyl-2-hydroxyethyl bacteriochlorophyllide A dehydrogenase